MCLIEPSTQGWLGSGSKRHCEQMKTLKPNECKKYSLQTEQNKLWRVPGLDVFMSPACRMHACDHGIFVDLWELTTNAVKMCGVYDNFISRFHHVGDFPKMKKYIPEKADSGYITATEHRILAQNLPFVLHGLVDHGSLMDCALKTAVDYVYWRQLLSEKSFTKKSLTNLIVAGEDLQKSMNHSANSSKRSHLGGPLNSTRYATGGNGLLNSDHQVDTMQKHLKLLI